jgi:hypothetical protein
MKRDFLTGPVAAARLAFLWKRWVAFRSLIDGRYLDPMASMPFEFPEGAMRIACRAAGIVGLPQDQVFTYQAAFDIVEQRVMLGGNSGSVEGVAGE